MAYKSIKLNNYELNNGTNRLVSDIDGIWGSSTADISSIEKPYSNGDIYIRNRVKSKTINLTGKLIESSQVNLENAIENFNKQVLGLSRLVVLEMEYLATTILVDVVVNKLSIVRSSTGGVSMADFSISLYQANPYYKVSPPLVTSLINISDNYNVDISSLTNSSYGIIPKITITINAFNPSNASRTIKVTNLITNEFVSVTRIWTVGEVLIFDMEKKQALVSNNLVYVTGTFFNFKYNSSILNYSDTATTRNVTIKVDCSSLIN